MKRVKALVIGRSLSPHDHSVFHKLSLIAFLAWVGLGADGLSSSCYGPQEAFLALGSHPYLSIFVGLASALTVFIISTSYSQIIELFPTGGGGYLVASKLLSHTVGRFPAAPSSSITC
jgi:amino acid transporter